MNKTKLLAGLTSFIIAASTCALYAGAVSNGKSDPENITKYLNGTYKGDLQSYDFDINCDNKTNILDLIYAKSAASGEISIDTEKTSVEYLNRTASALTAEARYMAQKLETEGVVLKKMNYSFEDLNDTGSLSSEELRILEHLDSVAKYYGTEKWAVSLSENNASCVTGDEIIQRTGAYPARIPRTLNIPFSSELTKQAAVYYYDWKKDFGKYISADPSIAELSDFSAQIRLNERNGIAKSIFTELQTLAQEYETKGKPVTDGKISSDDNSDLVKEFIKNCPEYKNVKWIADISDYTVNGVIIGSPLSGECGAYPDHIPENMNIPYSADLLPYASDLSKDWEKDFPDCITTDPEQLKYAELAKKVSTNTLNSYSKTLYINAQTLLQEYETNGIIVNFDGSSETEMHDKFIKELFEMLPNEFSRFELKYNISAKDGVVNGVIVSDGERTGAYPNAVPADLMIPYSDDLVKYSSGTAEVWKDNFSKYTIETISDKYPPNSLGWIRTAIIYSSNSNAKSVFTNAQTILQEMETRGEKLPEGMITSDDDTDLVKNIKADLFYQSDAHWAVYISGGVVKGVVYSSDSSLLSGIQTYDTETEKWVYITYPGTDFVYTGSYPNHVPADIAVKYDNTLVNKYGSGSDDWKWESSSGENTPSDQNGTDPSVPGDNDDQPSANVSQTTKALINSYNSSARTIYNGASAILMEHEIFGDPVPDGIITSDDGSDIAAEISNSVIGGGSRKWAVYVKDCMVTGIVYTENERVTGSYPSAVSSTNVIKYDHSLVMKYADGSVDWT